MSLHPVAEAKLLNTPEQDVESFRTLCLAERPEQLKYFNERFVKKLGKDGIKETMRIAKDYDAKVGTQKEFAVVSTEFTDFCKAQEIEFPSMKQRKEAFKDLDIDGNHHISLIEILIFINKDMVLGCSEDRWGVKPPSTGEEYTKAVLRELFLPAMGFEKSFDSALDAFVRANEANIAKKNELEASKEGLSGVKIRNVIAQIEKVDKDMELDKKNFDRDVPKAARIVTKAAKALASILEEIGTDEQAAEKGARGAVKKGQFEGK